MKKLKMPESPEEWKELRLNKGLNFRDMRDKLGASFMSYQWRLENNKQVSYWNGVKLFKWFEVENTKKIIVDKIKRWDDNIKEGKFYKKEQEEIEILKEYFCLSSFKELKNELLKKRK